MTSSDPTILPMGDRYPFLSPHHSEPKGHIHVRLRLQFGQQARFVMKEKVRMLKNLGFQRLIALENTFEAEQHLDLLFEFAPHSFPQRLPLLNGEVVERVKEEMYELAESLVAKGVEHEFRVENIGLDRKERLKYFLGFGFRIDRGMNKEDTLQRYRRIIDYFFACGGPLIKGRSPNKSLKNETADSSSKGAQENPSHMLLPTANLMKKSSTVDNSPIFAQPNRQLLTRYTFNCNNQVVSVGEGEGMEEEKAVQTRVVKMDQLGARINKLKSYMKELTGKTPTGSSGLAKFSMKIDANNFQNKIFQENKIMITPSYTKLEKKISEFRQSKLYRAYNEKEILYSKNNQGYQVLTTHRIQDNSHQGQNLEVKGGLQPQQRAIECVQTEPSRPSERKGQHVPSFFLQKKESINSAKQSPVTSPKSQGRQPSSESVPAPTSVCPFSSLKGSSSNKSSPFDSLRDTNNNLSTSKNGHQPADPQEKEYRQLATKDKYCEEFMFFLEGDEEESSPHPTQFDQEFFMPSPTPSQHRGMHEDMRKEAETAAHKREIQDRVNKAIRNSIKLISGLKAKDA